MSKEPRNSEATIGISARLVKTSFLAPKQVKITLTDGVDKWEFLTADTFTIAELKDHFPYFFKGRKD